MQNSKNLLKNAINCLHSGNLEGGDSICRHLLNIDPADDRTLHILAEILHRKGDLQNAERNIQKAISLKPKASPYHSCLGQIYLGKGDPTEALNAFKRASHLSPKQATPHYGIGLTQQTKNNFNEAIKSYKHALKLEPNHLQALCNLGAILHQTNKLQEAITCYKKGLKYHPKAVQLLYNSGLAYLQCEQLENAERCFEQTTRLLPGHTDAALRLIDTYKLQGHISKAIQRAQDLIKKQPHLTAAYCSYGTLLNHIGQNHTAIENLNKALIYDPSHSETAHNLGVAYMGLGDFQHAKTYFSKLVNDNHNSLELHYNLGVCLAETGDRNDAIKYFQKALKISPGFPKALAQLCRAYQAICDWANSAPIEHQLLTATKDAIEKGLETPIYPFDALALSWSPELQYHIAKSHSLSISSNVASLNHPPWQRQLTQKPPLRIGYVSTKFCNHAGAHLIVGLFCKHDRTQFEVFCYSIGPNDNSTYRKRIEDGCDHFVDVSSLSYTECAQRIHDDRIHILIDLAVFNTACRPEIFALKPAPIQVSYLGFPGTSGADYMDYIITDPVVTPPDQQRWYSEEFIYLPHCYQINDDAFRVSSNRPDKEDCGIPTNAFVFGCFNNSYKIDPSIFGVWMKILHQVPNSVFWLLKHSEQYAINLKNEAKKLGVSPERLIFADKLGKEDHLARHKNMDLFLDTRYYNAHTTASDALRVGVPVITILGDTFASRVAASILTTIDIPELITQNLKDYEELAVLLAKDKTRLAALQKTLLRGVQQCALFNTSSFTRSLESAYLSMYSFRSKISLT